MIDRQHGVRFAAAEGSLELDDGLAASAIEPLGDLGQQEAHAFGDEGALEEGGSVLPALKLAQVSHDHHQTPVNRASHIFGTTKLGVGFDRGDFTRGRIRAVWEEWKAERARFGEVG